MLPSITAAELADRLRRGEHITFVDARNPEAFAGSDVELPEAMRILPDQVDPHLAELPEVELIVAYDSDDDRSAGQVVERLHQLGRKFAVVLLGGIGAWRDERLPVQYKPHVPTEVPAVWGHS